MKQHLVRALIRIGLTRRNDDGTLFCPVDVRPRWMWRHIPSVEGWCGIFRNKPGVIRKVPGRWLPRRWGFRIWFLEIGDRGG